MSGIFGYPTDPAQSTGTVGTSAGEGGTVITEDAVAVKALNNALRGMAGDLGNFRNDIAAANISTGSNNAYVLATGSEISALADGMRLTWLPNHTNTDEATLNVDSQGAKKLLASNAALVAGNIVAGQPVDVVYDASADSAAGAWLVLNPVPVAASVSYTSDDIGDDSNYSAASVTAALNTAKAAHEANAAAITGKADTSHTHNASDIDAGTLALARLPVGTSANQIVQLDGSARLPAVDGSQLTNLPGGDFTPGYTSAEQTITAAGSLTLSHGLGGKPHLVQAFLRCKTAESNYSVGDEIEWRVGADTSYGFSCVPGTSSIFIRFCSTASSWIAPNKTTGGPANISFTNWRLIIKAWR